ncbi:MAG: hypothetical protein M4D80_08330 [Myxococcota bacterium]|nr:hypothetical protein [Myxococcota bacterium]
MRIRTSLGLAAAVSAGLVQTSSAVVRPKGAEAPIVSADQGPRTHRTTKFANVPGFTAIIDHDTNVPLRMWGKGQLVAGSVASPAVAEAAARQFLAQHIATLAPGSTASDFELVSNVLSQKGTTRNIGFIQRSSGIRVLGGSIGFAFKADKLMMISSTALPNISVAVPAMRLPSNVIASKAAQWLSEEGKSVRLRAASSFAPTERVIVPIVRPRLGATPDIAYRIAEHVALDAVDEPGAWDVWIDAVDARPIVRKSTIHYATGKVLFDTADRHPGGTRSAKGAIATHTVNGVANTSLADGSVTWAGTATASVALTLAGPFVAITNKAGTRVTDTMSLAPNGTLSWTKAADEMADAQLNAFVHANRAKEFAKAKLDPTMPWLAQTLSVVVNESQTCNAYSTGDDIHFFRKGSQCENTARLADVVYHEFGHSLHNHAIIDGVGAFDGALSEGMSDMFAALITRDHGMGRGFFFGDSPLRDLENNKKWPDDVVGQVHDDGEIIGATMWHLGEALEAKLGATAGYEKTIDIWYGALQRSTDIPSTYAEALVADDNDGDISNGTPNMCEINTAFGRHGLADPTLTLGIENPIRDNFKVSITATPGSASACPGPTVTGGKLEWKARGGTVAMIPLTAAGAIYSGDIPSQPDGSVVQYKVTLTLSDGSSIAYPKNDADPFYEFYVGEVEKIWCADFEAGIGEWKSGASVVSRNEWVAGPPMGLGGDPKTAFAGANVLGIDLAKDGMYSARVTQYAETPEIDASGETVLRLQYQRWLGVEDGFFDKAKVFVNGTQVWTNYMSPQDPQAGGVAHLDREWRFHDIDIKDVAAAAGGKVKVKFELSADEGLEMAGWTLDDVCIVAPRGAGLTCGNSKVDDEESCDDGNRIDGDGCSANCIDETPGGGCCSVGTGPEGAIALSMFTFGMLFVRRRRRR